ncbi:MAG: hypothetical protein ACT4P7_02255 [Gemmatimonadaceae bacterium]
MRAMRALWICPLVAILASEAQSQRPATTATGPLAVFLDCRADCDGELIRTEITWVNWVRDRTVSDVHVLITSQSAGGAGGEQFEIAFLGDRALAGRGDTLTFTTNPTTTSDERRRGVLQTISLGLVPFVARTSVGQTLRVTRTEQGARGAPQTTPKTDRWKAWVFEIEVGGSTNGERYYRNRELNAQLSANRVTEAWKTDFEYEFSYQDNRAIVQEYDTNGVVISEETFKNLQRDWAAELLQVKSISNHTSLGLRLEVASQTFRNQEIRYSLRPAIEYNIFPYSESTRRELTLRYGVGFTGYRYADTTIFNKISETLPTHFLEVGYNTRQPWGSVNINAEHRNFLNDASKRTTEVNGFFNVRIFRGFSVRMGGGYNWIRDQIYLPKGEQNQADVLLRRRALLTGFEYFLHTGVSYTFGSIFNNVVNPRF